jgi:hypothetical protein
MRNEDIKIPNFDSPFRYDRPNRTGGGVEIYVRKDIFGKIKNDLSLPEI